MSAAARSGRAVVAGAVATAALEAAAPLERRIVGGPLPFAPQAIADALCRRLGVSADPTARAALGRILRWTYGPAWAALYGLTRPRLPRSAVGRAALLAATIGGVELLALPLVVGRRLLERRVLAALALHIALFAGVVETTLSLADAARSR